MKLLLPIILSGLSMACQHNQVQTPHQPVQHADILDCENVYQYILTMTVNDKVDPGHTLNTTERSDAEFQLDMIWSADGKKSKFLRLCQKSMTVPQVDCTLHVNHVEEMNSCVTLVR